VARIDVDGLSIAYHRLGDGPPVVLVHGYVGDARSTWRHQLAALSDEFTVVACDLPGAGAAADPPEDFGLTGYADCPARFVASLELGPVHLVGLSLGGILAIEATRRHPSLVRTLVLASAYAGWYGSLPAEVADRRLEQALRLSELPAEAFVAALLPTMFAAAPAAQDVDAFRAAMLAVHPVGFRALARASAVDLSAALAGIAAPTLLLYGERDERAPLQVAQQLHAAIPASTLVILPQVGHVCSLEAPEAFNREVRAFVAKHRGRSTG
jgi:pimeloyl-ACP methyl ester carboxylesterase